MIKTAVFPVGGFGVRFLPVTKAIPKEMLPVFNKPLIQFAVEEALDAGVEKIILVTGRGKSAIENHFDYSLELECIIKAKYQSCEVVNSFLCDPGSIAYIRQQQPLGLGHAVWCARRYIDSPFYVILADDLILGENALKRMSEVHSESDGSNVLLLKKVPQALIDRYGIADVEKKDDYYNVKEVIEKPQPGAVDSDMSIVGRYILNPEIFDYLARFKIGRNQEIQLTDAISDMIQEGGRCSATEIVGEHFDCGSREGMLMATVRQAIFEGFKDDLLELLRG